MAKNKELVLAFEPTEDLWEGAERIYGRLLCLETLKDKKIIRYEPTSSCHIEIWGLSDGSILLISENKVSWKGNKKPSGNVHAIEAQKGEDSLWPDEPFRHDFKSKSKPKLVPIANNVIRIISSNGKKLWKPFEYSQEDVNAEPEYYNPV